MTDDVMFAGVAGQVAAIGDGQTTSEKLTEAVLARIERLNPRVNAFSEVLAESALAEARVRDADAPAERGPLHGVPMAIKQENDVAGSVTTFGGRANVHPATADNEVVRRLRAAGAVIVGKTTMPEFGLWPFTETEATGVTRNPWNLGHTPGGSSGGTAAAVAAGMVSAAIGGDGGGSIRIPSSCCGLFGLKSSRGRVSTAPHPHLWLTLGVIGPLTRSVLDSALIYDVISGSLPGDLSQAPPLTESLVRAAGREPGRLRIGWSTRPVTRGVKVDGEVVAAVRRLAALLSELGHDVREIDPRYPDPTFAFLPQVFGGVSAEAALVDHRDRLERRTRRGIRAGAWVRGPVIERAIRAGERVSSRANRVFDDVDVLLTPTLPKLPPAAPALPAGIVGAVRKALPMAAFTGLWNVTGNPAASVPAGFASNGLPIGAQLVGRAFDEPTLMSLSAQLERATDWTRRTPDLD